MKLNKHIVGKNNNMDTTTIYEGISVVGDVKGSHNLYLNGSFEGTIDLTALLLVGKTGKLKGEVKANYVIIEGEVEGKVIAKERVEVLDDGRYKGEILTPSVMISQKAFFDGVVKMQREGEDLKVASLTGKPQATQDESIKELIQAS